MPFRSLVDYSGFQINILRLPSLIRIINSFEPHHCMKWILKVILHLEVTVLIKTIAS